MNKLLLIVPIIAIVAFLFLFSYNEFRKENSKHSKKH